MADGAVHGPEKLRVYHLALAFARNVERVLFRCRCHPSLRSQLARTSQSIVLNIAEGSAHYSGPEKAYYYQTAYGCVAECTAALTRLAEQNPHRNLRLLRRDADMVSVMLLALMRAQNRNNKGQPPSCSAEDTADG